MPRPLPSAALSNVRTSGPPDQSAWRLALYVESRGKSMATCTERHHPDHTHQHGPNCGHTAVRHHEHVYYLHDGHLHHMHENHIDMLVMAHSRVPTVGTMMMCVIRMMPLGAGGHGFAHLSCGLSDRSWQCRFLGACLNLPIRPVCSQRDIPNIMTGCDTLSPSDQAIAWYCADGRGIGAAINHCHSHV